MKIINPKNKKLCLPNYKTGHQIDIEFLVERNKNAFKSIKNEPKSFFTACIFPLNALQQLLASSSSNNPDFLTLSLIKVKDLEDNKVLRTVVNASIMKNDSGDQKLISDVLLPETFKEGLYPSNSFDLLLKKSSNTQVIKLLINPTRSQLKDTLLTGYNSKDTKGDYYWGIGEYDAAEIDLDLVQVFFDLSVIDTCIKEAKQLSADALVFIPFLLKIAADGNLFNKEGTVVSFMMAPVINNKISTFSADGTNFLFGSGCTYPRPWIIPKNGDCLDS